MVLTVSELVLDYTCKLCELVSEYIYKLSVRLYL